MTPPSCARHPDALAQFVCEGCGARLCADCAEPGHRLVLCALCGERALPLAPSPGPPNGRRRQRAAATGPYTLADALRYPFRGQGAYLYWGYVVLLVVLGILSTLPFLGCGMLLVTAVLFLLVPGLLLAIVRSTAEGDDELPDWPDFSDVYARAGETLVLMVVGVVGVLPLVLLLQLGACGPERIGAHCWAILAAGLWLAAAIWVPALGATGTYDSWWLSFRADLHLRAVAAVGREAVATITGLIALFFASLVLRVALGAVPLLGGVLATALGVYTLFLSAHLTGLLFRRHVAALEEIYL